MGMQKQEFVEKGATKVVAGASLREPVAWHDINWRKAHRNVRRLQARIVKAKKKPRPVKGAFEAARAVCGESRMHSS